MVAVRALAWRPAVPAPLRRGAFRVLWAGMAVSFAGSRLQALAQTWLVATLTGSAVSVGLIAVLGALPQFLYPLGGVVGERVDRRRLLLATQLLGAAASGALALLVWAGTVTVWHVYAWALVGGIVQVLSRPAYKVAITEAVPRNEVRPAVALNSATEMGMQVVVNAGGSVLLAAVGLALGFVANAVSFLAAAAALFALPRGAATVRTRLTARGAFDDLLAGFSYLRGQPALLHPLLLTLLTLALAGPVLAVLAAVVEARGGTVVELGLLSAAVGVGSLAGAVYAGARGDGDDATGRYARLALVAAVGLASFALLPVGALSAPGLAAIGFVVFTQAVWNTSRVSNRADPAYQTRLQAVGSMVFPLGLSAGALWAGPGFDAVGVTALLGGAGALAALGTAVLAIRRPRPAAVEPEKGD